jgi:hypothetical protein
MLRRAVYIKHPSHLPIADKQKKDCAGVYLCIAAATASRARCAL